MCIRRQPCVILTGMNTDYAHAFADAVAREISAEMGRQGIRSSRALARKIGTSNHVSINDRLNLEPKSGKDPVPVNMVDLATYARALNVQPSELLRRAEESLMAGMVEDFAGDVSEGAAAYARGRSAGRGETPLQVNPSVTRTARRR